MTKVIFYGPDGSQMLEGVLSCNTTASDLVTAFASRRWRAQVGSLTTASPTGVVTLATEGSVSESEDSISEQVGASDADQNGVVDGAP